MAFRSDKAKAESKTKGRQNSIRRLQEEAAAADEKGQTAYAARRQQQADAMRQTPHPHA